MIGRMFMAYTALAWRHVKANDEDDDDDDTYQLLHAPAYMKAGSPRHTQKNQETMHESTMCLV